MATQGSPGFLGRVSECAALDRLLDDLRGGHSAVLVIRGEAGVGKSALLRYAAQRASGCRIVQISGVEAEMELPFAGLHQLCAPMLGQLDPLPTPQKEALRVALGISEGNPPDRFLVALAALSLMSEVAAERPLVCLVDDAQWLDRASSQVLGFVARRLLADSVALVFGVREPSTEHQLAGLPELLVRGLEEEDARALLEAVIPGRLDVRVRDRIAAETRGNPLALLELSSSLSTSELAGGFAIPKRGDLPSRIEEHYLERVDALPGSTQELLLLAAADPVGDAALLWRAAQILGIERTAAEPAEADHLLEIGARVRFRHPLVRSAVYRAASVGDQRAAHGALAAATDPKADPDRRAWHRAHATKDPDEEVASELVRCAKRAENRGGIAASAAFLERAVMLTPDPKERAERALAAARAKFEVGDFAAAESLLVAAEAGPLDEVSHAQVQRIYAQMAFDLRRGSDAPLLLLHAAERFERIDVELAQETYLEALVAAIYAAGLAKGTDVADVARAAHSIDIRSESRPARQLLLLGLSARLSDGYVVAAPALIQAVSEYRASERELDWLCVAFNLASMELWDDEAWFELASSQVDLARATGKLILLPYALDYLAGFYVQAGDLSKATRLLAEAEGLHLGSRAETLPYIPLRLAAWRGDASTSLTLVDEMKRGALARGEGCAISAADYAVAILYNGLGQYELACDAAEKAILADDMVTASWALPELIEAASRCGRRQVAADAVERLSERAVASGTDWAKGTAARARALIEDSEAAEKYHRQAIELLGHSRMRAQLARALLCYGEWLRRQNRRVDARHQLRQAYDALAKMGADGFAERAGRELLATGEKVRKRRDDTRNELTPQEEHIARLARDGRTNPEIGAALFISSRTVEWHLRKVFTKLGISSRKGLRAALPGRD
jgi:DNA-binding CsgD family transcriptional regulator